jgi:hypothetical protein
MTSCNDAHHWILPYLSLHLLSEAGQVPDLGHILGLLDLLRGVVLTLLALYVAQDHSVAL